MLKENKKFVDAMIDEAKSGIAEGGIPIGSVLVRSEKICNYFFSSTDARHSFNTAEKLIDLEDSLIFLAWIS